MYTRSLLTSYSHAAEVEESYIRNPFVYTCMAKMLILIE